MEHHAKTSQILVRMFASFALAYGLAGFLHAFVTVATVAYGSRDLGQVGQDIWIFMRFIAAETIEAPVNGGFLKMPGNDGDISYINLYPFIAPVFVTIYFVSAVFLRRKRGLAAMS